MCRAVRLLQGFSPGHEPLYKMVSFCRDFLDLVRRVARVRMRARPAPVGWGWKRAATALRLAVRLVLHDSGRPAPKEVVLLTADRSAFRVLNCEARTCSQSWAINNKECLAFEGK